MSRQACSRAIGPVLATALLGAFTLALGAAPSWAVAPTNDDISHAQVIAALPFSAAVDVTEATLAAGETACDDRPTQQTVWYTLTFPTDRRIVLDRRASDYESYLGIFTGTPGSLSQVFCSFYRSPVSVFQARAGVTYHMQIGAWTPVPGFPAQRLDLQIYDVPIPPVEISAAVTRATLTQDGLVRLAGEVRCNHESEYTLRGTASQVRHHRVVTGEFATDAARCETNQSSWHAVVRRPTGRFHGSQPLDVVITASACDEWGCGSETTRISLPLRVRH